MDGSDPLDAAIDEALGESARADELANLVEALEIRRKAMERELQSAGDENRRRQLKARLAEISRQVEVLRQEQVISGFVERSVRASAARPRPLLESEEPD